MAFPNEALDELRREFGQRIAERLKSLLESKHLYQSILLEYEDLLDVILKRVTEYPGLVRDQFPKLVQGNWAPVDNAYRGMVHSGQPSGVTSIPLISFNPQDVKLFCQTCSRIEAFNSISSEDFLQRDQPSRRFESSGQAVQLFIFSFLCQSCKTIPEVFMVRREGLKLTNSGRSPIEYVDVPSAIPNPVKRFYRGAVVAHQSGQTLAGNFLLRTLIEQWARLTGGKSDLLADDALEAYMKTLPEDFKQRFPSFPKLYEDLSADIHAAKGDSDLFEKACADIIKHFDARRLFEL